MATAGRGGGGEEGGWRGAWRQWQERRKSSEGRELEGESTERGQVSCGDGASAASGLGPEPWERRLVAPASIGATAASTSTQTAATTTLTRPTTTTPTGADTARRGLQGSPTPSTVLTAAHTAPALPYVTERIARLTSAFGRLLLLCHCWWRIFAIRWRTVARQTTGIGERDTSKSTGPPVTSSSHPSCIFPSPHLPEAIGLSLLRLSAFRSPIRLHCTAVLYVFLALRLFSSVARSAARRNASPSCGRPAAALPL